MNAYTTCIWRQGIFRYGPRRTSKIPFTTTKRRFFSTDATASYKLDETTGLLFVKGDKKQPRFQTIVGLEIHAQLDIPTKLFSPGRPSQHHDVSTKPNSTTTTTDGRPALHPYDVAVPGYLPVISKEAVQAAVVAARVLHCEIQTTSRFERKHYTYADLPFHYQITQQRWPLAINGEIEASLEVNHEKQKGMRNAVKCRINRIQLEQDTGKTIQGSFGLPNKQLQVQYSTSCVDFNRAGQALIEIVMEPDLRTPQEASAITDAIRQLLKHVGVCDGRMEEGSLRCDVNVNIEQISPQTDGEQQQQNYPRRRSPRVEVKNLNSIRQVRDAIKYEVLRQAREWEEETTLGGGNQAAETRTWDPVAKETELLRKKDQDQDYRFMPEPDLPPLVLNEDMLGGLDLPTFLETRMPELPSEAIDRLKNDYAISDYQANIIATDIPAIAFFERAVATVKDELERSSIQVDHAHVSGLVAGFLTRELFGLVKENESDASIQDSHVSSDQLGQVVALFLNDKFSGTSAGYLLRILYREERGGDPAAVAKKIGLALIKDRAQLRAICNLVIDENPKQLEQYLRGETKVIKFFNGKTMIACQRNADPETLQQILEEVLEERAKAKK